MKDVNVTLSNTVDTEKPVVLLTGKALEPKYPEAVELTGILSAPADFLEHKKDNYNPLNCHVRVDRVAGSIMFLGDDKLDTGEVIAGKLVPSAAFSKFAINTGKLFTAFDLAALFRQNKFWFASAEEHAEILKNLNNFSAKVSTKVEQMQHNSGATKQLFEREVTDIAWKREFRLCVPIFEGYKKRTFRVEIGVSPTDMTVKLFLESDEVYEIFEAEKEELIKEQVKRFEKFKCSIVYLT